MNKEKTLFNTKINEFYKSTSKERNERLVKALNKASIDYLSQWGKKFNVDKNKHRYESVFHQQMVQEALISGYMKSKFRGKLGTQYHIIKMVERGATGKKVMEYLTKTFRIRAVQKNILINQEIMLGLMAAGFVLKSSSKYGKFNQVRLLIFKKLGKVGQEFVIPESEFANLTVEEIISRFEEQPYLRKIKI